MSDARGRIVALQVLHVVERFIEPPILVGRCALNLTESTAKNVGAHILVPGA